MFSEGDGVLKLLSEVMVGYIFSIDKYSW
jgi:hypothetical protein